MATNVDRAACRMLLLPAVAFLVLAVLASLPSAAVATNYTVGDEKGWNPKVDYTAWVKKHRPFYKGDWLRKPTHSSPRITSIPPDLQLCSAPPLMDGRS